MTKSSDSHRNIFTCLNIILCYKTYKGLHLLFLSPVYVIYSSTSYWGSCCSVFPAGMTAANLLYWFFPAASCCIILIKCWELIPAPHTDSSPHGGRISRQWVHPYLCRLSINHTVCVPLERNRLWSGAIIRMFSNTFSWNAGRSGRVFINGVLRPGHSWPTSTKNDWWQSWLACRKTFTGGLHHPQEVSEVRLTEENQPEC